MTVVGTRDVALARGLLRVRFPPDDAPMVLFFSNRLGCLASLAVSAVATLLVLWLLGWL